MHASAACSDAVELYSSLREYIGNSPAETSTLVSAHNIIAFPSENE